MDKCYFAVTFYLKASFPCILMLGTKLNIVVSCCLSLSLSLCLSQNYKNNDCILTLGNASQPFKQNAGLVPA